MKKHLLRFKHSVLQLLDCHRHTLPPSVLIQHLVFFMFIHGFVLFGVLKTTELKVLAPHHYYSLFPAAPGITALRLFPFCLTDNKTKICGMHDAGRSRLHLYFVSITFYSCLKCFHCTKLCFSFMAVFCLFLVIVFSSGRN